MVELAGQTINLLRGEELPPEDEQKFVAPDLLIEGKTPVQPDEQRAQEMPPLEQTEQEVLRNARMMQQVEEQEGMEIQPTETRTINVPSENAKRIPQEAQITEDRPVVEASFTPVMDVVEAGAGKLFKADPAIMSNREAFKTMSGEEIFTKYYATGNPEADQIAREQIMTASGFLTNVSEQGSEIEGSTDKDGRVSIPSMIYNGGYVDTFSYPEGSMKFSDLSFDKKMRNMATHGAVALAHQTLASDPKGISFGPSGGFYRVYATGNNIRHQSLIGATLNENGMPVTVNDYLSDVTQKYVTDGQVDKSKIEAALEQDEDIARLNRTLLANGMSNINDRMYYIERHIEGTRSAVERGSGILDGIKFLGNMAIGVLNRTSPETAMVDPYLSVLNPAEYEARIQRASENKNSLPHLLLAGSEYMAAIKRGDPEIKGLPEGFEVTDGKISVKYLPYVAEEFSKLFPGMTSEQAQNILDYDESWVEVATELVPEVVTVGGVIRHMYLAGSSRTYKEFIDYAKNDLKLNSPEEVETAFQTDPTLGPVLVTKFMQNKINFSQRSKLNPRYHINNLSHSSLKNKLSVGAQQTEAGREELVKKSRARFEQYRNDASNNLESFQNATNPTELITYGSRYVKARMKAVGEQHTGSMLPYNKEFYKDEALALAGGSFGVMIAQESGSDFPFLYEIGGAIAGVTAPSLAGLVARGAADTVTGIITIADNAATDLTGVTFFGKLASGESLYDATRNLPTLERAATEKAYNSMVANMSPAQREQFDAELIKSKTMVSEILDLQKRLGINIIKEEDLPIVLGNALQSSHLMAISESLQAQIAVGDIQNLPQLLSAQSTISAKRREFAINMFNMTESLLQYEDDLSVESVGILKSMRAHAVQEQQRVDELADQTTQQVKDYQNTVGTLLKDGAVFLNDGAGGVDTNSLLDVHETMLDDIAATELGGVVNFEAVARYSDAVDAANKNLQDGLNDTYEAMRNVSSGIDETAATAVMAKGARARFFQDKTDMRKDYAKVEAMGLTLNVEGNPVPALVDLSDIMLDISGQTLDIRSAFGEVVASGDIGVLKPLSRLNRNIPQEKRILLSAEKAADRHYSHQITGDKRPAQIMRDTYELLPDSLKKKFPLDVLEKSDRSIDAWIWQRDFLERATESDLAKVPDEVIDILPNNLDDRDVDLAGMQLPYSVTEVHELATFLNRSAYSKGVTSQTRSVVYDLRNQVLERTEKGLVNDFYGTNPQFVGQEVMTQYRAATAKARDFYNRYDDPDIQKLLDGDSSGFMKAVMSPLSDSKLKGVDDVRNALDKRVVPKLARVYGEYNSELGEYVLVAGSENTEKVKGLVINYFNTMYLKSDAGKYLTSLAEVGNAPLGLSASMDGVRIANMTGRRGTWADATFLKNNYASHMREMMNIPLYTRTSKIVENPKTGQMEEVITMEPSADRLVQEHEVFDFARIDRALEIPKIRDEVIKLENDLDIEVTKNIRAIDDEASGRKIQVDGIRKFAEANLGKDLTKVPEEEFYNILVSPVGREAVENIKTDYIADAVRNGVNEADALNKFNKNMGAILSKALIKNISKTDPKAGIPMMDLDALNTALRDEQFVAAMSAYSPERLESLTLIRDFGYRILGKSKDDISITGKPLPVSMESMINKAWQVSRNTVSPRYLILEVLFRNSRREGFNAIVTMLNDPKVARGFMEMAETGRVLDEERMGTLAEQMMTFTVIELAEMGADDNSIYPFTGSGGYRDQNLSNKIFSVRQEQDILDPTQNIVRDWNDYKAMKGM